MAYGKSVQLYLVDGTPGGLMIAEIVNWTGVVLSCPRSQLGSLLKREEVNRTGVYLLLGEDPENPTQTMAYIGETDEVKKRLIQHAKAKDFWNRAIVIINKDLNMTKAHVRYLEYRMIAKSRAAKRAKVENANDAVMSVLPEAAKSDMEQFLEQIDLILPLLNVNIMRQPITVSSAGEGMGTIEPARDEPVIFELFNKKHGIYAHAQEIGDEFIVLRDSHSRPGFTQQNHSYTQLKSTMETDGTLVPTSDPTRLKFAAHTPFTSPSAAGAIVNGRPTNGRVEWKVKGTNQTYHDWQQSKVDAAVTNAP